MGEEERTTDTLLESAAGRGMLRRDRRVDVGERQVASTFPVNLNSGPTLEDPVFVLC
jgi:hypothetical protein